MTRCNPYRLVGGAVFMGVILSLSACGGSSSSGSVSGPPATTPPPTTTPPPVTPPPVTPPPTTPLPPPDLTSFNRQVAQGREDFAALETTPILPSAKMPVTGIASYSGVVLYKLAGSVITLPDEVIVDTILESPSMSSDISLQANFGADSISGNLGGFNDSTTGSFSGAVWIQNGTISGNKFEGDLSGTVFKGGTPRSAAGAISGSFLGSTTPDAAVGAVGLNMGAGGLFLGVFSAD
jgi:hypothetical protein